MSYTMKAIELSLQLLARNAVDKQTDFKLFQWDVVVKDYEKPTYEELCETLSCRLSTLCEEAEPRQIVYTHALGLMVWAISDIINKKVLRIPDEWKWLEQLAQGLLTDKDRDWFISVLWGSLWEWRLFYKREDIEIIGEYFIAMHLDRLLRAKHFLRSDFILAAVWNGKIEWARPFVANYDNLKFGSGILPKFVKAAIVHGVSPMRTLAQELYVKCDAQPEWFSEINCFDLFDPAAYQVCTIMTGGGGEDPCLSRRAENILNLSIANVLLGTSLCPNV